MPRRVRGLAMYSRLFYVGIPFIRQTWLMKSDCFIANTRDPFPDSWLFCGAASHPLPLLLCSLFFFSSLGLATLSPHRNLYVSRIAFDFHNDVPKSAENCVVSRFVANADSLGGSDCPQSVDETFWRMPLFLGIFIVSSFPRENKKNRRNKSSIPRVLCRHRPFFFASSHKLSLRWVPLLAPLPWRDSIASSTHAFPPSHLPPAGSLHPEC